MATARRWRCPPESLPTQASAFSASCSSSRTSAEDERLAIEAGEQVHGFADGELLREARFLQRDAQPLAQLRASVVPGMRPRISTSPEVGCSKPSRISMVVVLPAPLGPSRPKHSPAWISQVEAAHGLDFAVVGLAQAAALDGDAHGLDCSGVFGEATRARCLEP